MHFWSKFGYSYLNHWWTSSVWVELDFQRQYLKIKIGFESKLISIYITICRVTIPLKLMSCRRHPRKFSYFSHVLKQKKLSHLSAFDINTSNLVVHLMNIKSMAQVLGHPFQLLWCEVKRLKTDSKLLYILGTIMLATNPNNTWSVLNIST